RDHKMALATAKSLYNVAGTKNVSNTLSVFRQVLPASQRGELRDQMFKLLEEIPEGLELHEGVMAQINAEAQPAEALMKDVKVDPAPYEPANERYQQREDFEGLMGLGILQLMSDKPQDAMRAFEKARQKANTEQQQQQVTDGFTR